MTTEHFIKDNIMDNINNANPICQINEKEFDSALLQFGSYISIVKNKRINQTMLLILLLDNKDVRDIFKYISGIENTQMLLYNLILRFPVLCRSKIIKNKIKEISHDRKRKRIV